MGLDKQKEIVILERYLKNQGRVELIETLRSASPEALKRKLTEQAEYDQAQIDLRNKDEKLKEAKDKARSLGSNYNENLRMSKKISRFVHLLMNDK